MKPLRPARRRDETGPPALELLEQAWHLLRTAPAAAHAAWAAGAVPFAVALLYFAGDMSRGADARGRLPAAAFVLALAFLWMKMLQAESARRLRAAIAGAPPAPPTFRRGLAMLRNQAALQPWGLAILPLSALAVLPLPWTLAYFQSLTALDDGTRSPGALHGRALRQAFRWPHQNLNALAAFAFFAFFAWADLFVLMAALPGLLKSFLGLETPFTIVQGWDSLKLVFNSTFLSVQLALAWLALDPLLKALYAVRCWHGEAIESGADLRALVAALRADEREAA